LGREALEELIVTVPLNCMYRCEFALYQNQFSGIGEVFDKAVECCVVMMGKMLKRGMEKKSCRKKRLGRGEEAVVCGLVCALEPMSTKPDLIESSM
jgi:hypothetical protein